MNWLRAGQKDLPELIRLLCIKEWEHMHFSSRIYNKGKPKLPGRKGSVYLLPNFKGQLKAAVMFWDKCQIFPCFPNGELTDPELKELEKISRRETPGLFSLIGSGTSVSSLLSYLKQKPEDLISYHSMTLRTPYPATVPARLQLKQALTSDQNLLFPLEEAYQREEVLRNPEYLNIAYAKKIFHRQIKEQFVVFGTEQGIPVSKSATNARGFLYDQLGGIFTIPEKRNCGYALETLQYLLNLIEDSQRESCLFVKVDNPSAIKLYQKAGFQNRGIFKIAYFF